MHSFEARTKPDPRSLRSCKQQSSWARALTVWCKHRVSEAPDFFPWRGPTRCKQMAVAFLNMPPRAVGRRPLQGQRRENTLARKMALGPGLGAPPLALITRTIRAGIYQVVALYQAWQQVFCRMTILQSLKHWDHPLPQQPQ